LISKFAGNVHLDLDAVLLGELAFAPFDRLVLFGVDVGAQSLWLMGFILFLNIAFIMLFFKELKIATFDPELSASLGFNPRKLHYGLMALVSITAVGAFDAVGSVLVVALMIAIPATAYLLTHNLKVMLFLSAFIGILSAVSGYGMAYVLDASIAGSMATMSGVLFLLVFLFAPRRGFIAKMLLHSKRKIVFASHLLTVHLLSHEGTSVELRENTVGNMHKHMRWEKKFAKDVVSYAIREEFLERKKNRLFLTDLGRVTAKKVMVQG
jgi:manganese/zinc/iron transport system permease protein